MFKEEEMFKIFNDEEIKLKVLMKSFSVIDCSF